MITASIIFVISSFSHLLSKKKLREKKIDSSSLENMSNKKEKQR